MRCCLWERCNKCLWLSKEKRFFLWSFRGLESQYLTRFFGDRKSWPEEKYHHSLICLSILLCLSLHCALVALLLSTMSFFSVAAIFDHCLKKTNFQFLPFSCQFENSTHLHISVSLWSRMCAGLHWGGGESMSTLSLRCGTGWRAQRSGACPTPVSIACKGRWGGEARPLKPCGCTQPLLQRRTWSSSHLHFRWIIYQLFASTSQILKRWPSHMHVSKAQKNDWLSIARPVLMPLRGLGPTIPCPQSDVPLHHWCRCCVLQPSPPPDPDTDGHLGCDMAPASVFCCLLSLVYVPHCHLCFSFRAGVLPSSWWLSAWSSDF